MPTSATFIAKPASSAAQLISVRASRSSGVASAAGRALVASRTASRPSASPTGVCTREITDPMACPRASTPPQRVGPAGSDRVSLGSTRQCWARLCGLGAATFSPVAGSVITTPPVTSLPVPAVVGTVTSGMSGPANGSGSPGQVYRAIDPGLVSSARAPLAVSIAEPPPRATTTSACPAATLWRSCEPSASTEARVGSPGATSATMTCIARRSRSVSIPDTRGEVSRKGSTIRNGA